MKQRALLLLGLSLVTSARAGLLEDDEARQQIKQVDARVQQLDARLQKVADETQLRKLDEMLKQQTKSLLDLQGQIEALNAEIRKLRGQNEEIAHGLQDEEKRQKDFYVDLDTRVRHFETAEDAAKETAAKEAAAKEVAAREAAAKEAAAKAAPPPPVDPSDPAPENRAFESAYGLFKADNYANAAKAFQDFLKKYPESVHVPNAYYWLGNAQFAQKSYKAALETYQKLLKDFPGSPKAADALYGVAGCQQGLQQAKAAHKTLKQLVAQYPHSEAAVKAKKQLAVAK